jgi:hypothetical protein
MILRVDMSKPETEPTVIPYSLNDIISDIKPGFAFARYGDGEWKLVLDSPWREGLNENFTPDLCEAMRGTLLNYNGVKLGMQSAEYLKKRELFEPAQEWLKKNKLDNLKWYESDVLHKASFRGELQPFANAVRGAISIGPDYFSTLPFISKNIAIPYGGVWSHRKEVFKKALQIKDSIVLVSAGPLAKVLVHKLHELDQNNAIIDTGAVFDPYCGHRSRGYMKDKKKKFTPLV